MSKQSINIFWFRRDLRLDDNIGLYNALHSDLPVLPIFIFDKNILDDLSAKDDARLNFIRDELEAINEKIREKGSTIKTFHTTPLAAFEELLDTYEIKEVYANEDYEPYAIDRDQEIEKLLESHSAVFKTFKDQVIFAKDEVLKDDGTPYLVYTPFSKRWISNLKEDSFSSVPNSLQTDRWFQSDFIPIPSIEDLGFKKSTISIPSRSVNTDIIKEYAEQRDIPHKENTSRLGIHLRFGTISIRKLAKIAQDHSEIFLKELIWREFFMLILYHFPKVVDHNYNSKYDSIKWRNNEEDFEKWKQGKTGFPMIDAGMRQMNETGFMHNRVRMIVASFLTKHLLIDWKWGEAYFAEKLLDYELASNNGNWQWAAGTGVDAQPYFRVFNPDSQQKKFDPKFTYIKRWISEYGTDDYPTEMVEHKFARERAIQTYKEAANA